MSSFSDMDWAYADTVTIRAALSEGRITSEELVTYYVTRITQIDEAGPHINSVAEINPDAVAEAWALDRERRRYGPRSPLHGIPVLIKDNIATGDRMHTTAGSWALADHYAPRDAHLVTRLRQAGALLLGKTQLTEWANFISDHMPNGYSSRGDQVLNPYGPGVLDPGGSSSGSGAALAGGLAPLTVGTETSGSILSPATQNGVVGIKPTVGLISRTGIVPIAWSQDTAGPMARRVADAAALLTVLAGEDAEDPATRGISRPTDYTRFVTDQGLKGARIGWPRAYWDQAADWQRLLGDTMADNLRRESAEIVEVDLPRSPDDEDYTVLIYEFKPALNAFLAKWGPSHLSSLEAVMAFNARYPDRCLQYGQAIFEAAAKTTGHLKEPAYWQARLRDQRQSRQDGIDRVLTLHRLDALIFPGAEGAALAAKAGYPSIALPIGYGPTGAPFGVSWTASAWSEPRLITLASSYEAHYPAQQKPTFDFLPT
ncbi:MAG: amidase family protein [Sulfobacillus sp.]|nr:amidase family protein [Sulfobacillus sp.]